MRGIGLIRLRIGILESHCECGIEAAGSISHRVSYYSIVESCVRRMVLVTLRYDCRKPIIRIALGKLKNDVYI